MDRLDEMKKKMELACGCQCFKSSFFASTSLDFPNLRTEYDPMHPQRFLFADLAPTASTDQRAKRSSASMPKLRFEPPSPNEQHAQYWNNVAQDILDRQLHKNRLNRKVAKNVIMFLGDGLSIPTLAATRVYLGDESTELSFERFPYVGLSKVGLCKTSSPVDELIESNIHSQPVWRLCFDAVFYTESLPLLHFADILRQCTGC